ncbi:MAG: DNA polymerase IV [Chloroflexi bacterium]|nr:DNA polymerase IV [Chloroflexota bacterium]
MARCIFHIDLDAFFVSVERVYNPDLRGKPVVVGGDPRGRGVVACASYEARVYGLKSGMPLGKAHRLCPHAIFLSGDFHRYSEASAKFMAILGDFTPDIEPMGLEEAYLDLTGFEPLYGPAGETALRVKKRVKDELGLTASVGIATSKIVAKVASGLSKPDGLIEVPAGQERAFLSPLPLSKLPFLGFKGESVLKRMGITTIGGLSRLPLSFLKQTFGVHGEMLYRYANGIDNSKVQPLMGPPRSISRSTTFSADTSDRGFLKAMLHYLGERVGAELRAGGRQAKCITLKLRYTDFQTITRSHTLREAVDTDRAIFEVGCRLLERALEQRAVPVRLIGIGVSHLAEGRQLNMFDTWAEALERLNLAIDKIRDKYGFNAIEAGCTMPLREVFPTGDGRYLLRTPSLSR